MSWLLLGFRARARAHTHTLSRAAVSSEPKRRASSQKGARLHAPCETVRALPTAERGGKRSWRDEEERQTGLILRQTGKGGGLLGIGGISCRLTLYSVNLCCELMTKKQKKMGVGGVT